MTTYTSIPNSSLEPGKPIRSIDGLALRDNPIAITEGASGAPKIAAAALQTGANERDWVLARTAAADVGAVGTYAFLGVPFGSYATYTPGSTASGSSLRYTGSASLTQSGTPSGTWRCMGYTSYVSDGEGGYFVVSSSLWLRIS